MKQRVFISTVLAIVSLLFSGCGTYHYLAGQTIRPGMAFDKVHSRMGRPDIGFGLPQKGTSDESWLYYKIPFGKYLVVNFVGYTVDDPPISIEDRSALVP